MKTRVLIIIGFILTTAITSSLLLLMQSDDSGPFIRSEYVEITGTINHWQPIDGPAYSLITNKAVNARVSDAGIFLYGDMLRPHMKDKTVTIKGTLVPNYVEYKGSLGLRHYGGDPSTATILVDDIQIKQESKPQGAVSLNPVPFVEFSEDEIVNTLLPLIDDSDAKRVYQSSKKSDMKQTRQRLASVLQEVLVCLTM